MNWLAVAVPAVRVEGVVKRFGACVAVDGAGLGVPGGMVFGLLGPNGAGQPTVVRILATRVAPEGGRAEVFGNDVAGEPAAVGELLGLTGQFAAVDEILTGRENLEMFGRLFKLSRAEARRRAGELLDRFDLAQAADRPARTYSGGMRRRLAIASSLLTRPRVLFLDEPTTGLDPRSRNEIWASLRRARRGRRGAGGEVCLPGVGRPPPGRGGRRAWPPAPGAPAAAAAVAGGAGAARPGRAAGAPAAGGGALGHPGLRRGPRPQPASLH